jgi:AcrR family transcriptional regulator
LVSRIVTNRDAGCCAEETLLDGRPELSSNGIAMKVPRSTDRRVLHTRAALRNALLALIPERGWDAIGIRDICSRAQIGRSTFYTHFADKDELLFSGFDDLKRMLRATARMASDSRPLTFIRGLIDHVEQNKRMFRALTGKRASQVAVRRLLQLMVELIREDLAPLLPPDRLDPAVHFLSGGLVELLAWWVETRSPLPGEDIERLFLEFATRPRD